MSNFRKIRSITKNLLKMSNNRPYYLRFTSKMFKGKKIGDKEAATLLDCVNLETGEECQIIVGAVLAKELDEAYEGGSYQGKCFEIVKFRDTAHDYNTYNLSEIAPPEDETPADNTEESGQVKDSKGKKA